MSPLPDAVKLAFDQRYRRYLTTLFLSGTAESSSLPIVSLYVTKDLGASNSSVGFLWMAMLVGSVFSLCIGYVSDRSHSNIPYVRYVAAWLSLGWVALMCARTFTEVLLVFAFSLSTAPILDSQIFTSLEDVMTVSGETRRSFITSTMRAGFSVGYVIGPTIGAVLVDITGFRAAFSVTAVLFLLAAVVGRDIRSRTPAGERMAEAAHNGALGGSSIAVLAIFCTCVFFVLCGDFLKYSYLSLYVLDVLKQPLSLYSGVIAAGAALEVFAFPIFGALADRFEAEPIIAIGLLLGIGDYGILALSPHVWSVYVSQILHVAVVAIVYGVCAAYAQRIAGNRTGVATASFFVAISMAQIGAGGIGASLTATLGLQHLFWIPSIMAAIGLSVFVLLRLLGSMRSQ
jgi:SET family sugar efflux transporter-like MFS transporter